jgi:biotin carboxyl carrier protein
MPGIIIGVNIKKGQKVQEGDTLLYVAKENGRNQITVPSAVELDSDR